MAQGWRKLHLAVDAETGEIVASDLIARRAHDCTQVPPLLAQIIDPIASVSADGAYDTKAVYKAAQGRGKGRAVRVLIPPGRDAQLSLNPSTALRERNRNIRSIGELPRREWNTQSGYSKRSLVESTMYRYKTIIGRSMRSRTFDGQRVEVQLASKILNTMTPIGMPDSYRSSGVSSARGMGDVSANPSHATTPHRNARVACCGIWKIPQAARLSPGRGHGQHRTFCAVLST